MISSSSSKAERLSALQVRLADLNEQFETCSWADFDVVEVHAEILEIQFKISLLQTNFDEQL